MRLSATCGIPTILGLHIAADLETDVSARNVVEALAVEGADLHVLDRLGLDGKIGSLRPRHCDKSCRRAEEKTFHHLHSNLQVALYGRVSSPPGAPQWKVPFSPLVRPDPGKAPIRPKSETWRLRDAPSVARVNLLDDRMQTINNEQTNSPINTIFMPLLPKSNERNHA